MGIKDEEMEGLSDEERAALEDDDEDSEILKGIAGDDVDQDEEGDDEAADANGSDADGDADDGDGAVGEQAGAEDNGAVVDEKVIAAVTDEFRPELKADRPEGLDEKLNDLETQTKDLLTKFKEGDIDMPEFMAQKEAIDAEKLKLTMADAQAKWAESQNIDTRDQRWKWEQERFFAQDKASIYKDPIILAALDASVKKISADPANAKKPAGFFLEEADRQIRNLFNAAGETGKEKSAPNRQPDLSKVPKTLAQLPAAEMAETGDVEFAYLDKLDGIALEQALRKLTPEQEARYLGASA